jgi:hypothetical protein
VTVTVPQLRDAIISGPVPPFPQLHLWLPARRYYFTV